MRQLLLFPEALPATVEAVRTRPSRHVRALADALANGVRSPKALLDIVADVPTRPDGVKLDRWEWHETTRRTEQFAILDRFFAVNRTAADAPEMFCHGVAVAYRGLLDDTFHAGTGLDAARWNELRWGLETVIRFGTGAERLTPADSPVPAGRAARDPHRRWRTGHQVFFPLVQAILVGLRCFISAALDEDDTVAAESMHFATDVMRASARALEFAADFPPDVYGSAVRPSMTPPGVPQALSGLMSADHHAMVVCFQKVQAIAATITGSLRGAYDAFVDTVEETYQAHHHVCTRFNGDRVVSLRMNHSSSMTAAEVLEHLGRARVKGLRSS